MPFDVNIRARWDDDARVWTATSAEIEGLVIEAQTLPECFVRSHWCFPNFLN